MYFDAVFNWCVLIWGVLGFFGRRVKTFGNQVGDVVFHGESESVFIIVPCEVYDCIQISFTIIGDVVMFSEEIVEMMGM